MASFGSLRFAVFPALMLVGGRTALRVLNTTISHRTHSYPQARAQMLGALAELEAGLDAAREGGGERAVTRHHARGRLLPRERIDLLVDRDSPVLEIGALAGWGTGLPVGAAVVTALGVVEGRPCVLVADDPTVPLGGGSAATLRKVRRAQQISLENRLPLITLAEGATEPEVAPADPAASFWQAGQVAAGLARLAAAGIPTTRVEFGVRGPTSEPPAPHDLAIAVQISTEAATRRYDHLAYEDRDALRLARECASRFPGPRQHPVAVAAEPKHELEDLLAVSPSEPLEILGRLLDGSGMDELRSGEGGAVCTGWGQVHGHPVAVLADTGAPPQSDSVEKMLHLVRLAGRTRTPLVFLQHGSAPPQPEHGRLLATITESEVPVLTVRIGRWRGPAAIPALSRFRFAWPRADAEPEPGGELCSALELSGRLADDGVIDPRDTRTVLGMCLAVVAP